MDVAKPIERVRNWHAVLAAWQVAQLAMVGLLGVALFAILAARLLGLEPFVGIVVRLGGPAVLLAAALVGWRRRPNPVRAAWLLDGALASKNLFGTLLELGEDAGPARGHLAAKAEGIVDKLHPPSQFPVRMSRIGKWSWLPAILLVGALFLPQQDPFGWHDARQRQAARDQIVATATAAIDRQLASPVLSEASRAMLEAAKSELATVAGEHEATAVLAKLQQQAAAAKSELGVAMAQEILRETAAAADPDSTVAALASSPDQAGGERPQGDNPAKPNANQQTAGASNPGSKPGTQPGQPKPGGETGNSNDADPKATEAGSQQQASAGQEGGEPGNASADGSGAEASSQASNDGGGQAGDSGQAGNGSLASPGGGSGGNGIGRGGGGSPGGGGGEISLVDVHVRGDKVDGKTIEELMRYDDDDPGNKTPRQFRQATAAAAANAQAGLARSRVPNAAAAAVRGYFESIAADAED